MTICASISIADLSLLRLGGFSFGHFGTKPKPGSVVSRYNNKVSTRRVWKSNKKSSSVDSMANPEKDDAPTGNELIKTGKDLENSVLESLKNKKKTPAYDPYKYLVSFPLHQCLACSQSHFFLRFKVSPPQSRLCRPIRAREATATITVARQKPNAPPNQRGTRSQSMSNRSTDSEAPIISRTCWSTSKIRARNHRRLIRKRRSNPPRRIRKSPLLESKEVLHVKQSFPSMAPDPWCKCVE